MRKRTRTGLVFADEIQRSVIEIEMNLAIISNLLLGEREVANV